MEENYVFTKRCVKNVIEQKKKICSHSIAFEFKSVPVLKTMILHIKKNNLY